MKENENQTQKRAFDPTACLEMMNEIMDQSFEDCDCGAMLSQINEIISSPDFKGMISELVNCCVIEEEKKPAS